MMLGSEKCAKKIARKKGPEKLKYEARFKKSAKGIALKELANKAKMRGYGIRERFLKNGLRSFR